MGEDWRIGRKAIVIFLRPYIGLSVLQKPAWRKVARWKKDYGLPIEYDPSGRPYIDPRVFELWITSYRKKVS